MRKVLVILVVFLWINGCASLRTAAVLKYNNTPPSSKTKIFLVAAADNSANFAQEIMRQKKIWLSRGMKEEDINCYYALPSRGTAWWDRQ